MSPATRRARYTLIMALLLFAGLAGAYLYISSRAARLVSGALTDALGQPVSVSFAGFSPESGLTLYGLEVRNPDGFKSPYLANIKSLNITPDYSELAKGRLVFNSLGVFSPTVYLEKDRSGRWNFQPLLDTLKKSKTRMFTLSRTAASAGKLYLVNQGMTFYLPSVKLGDLSSLEPAPTAFTFTVKDDKGSTATLEGEAGIYTKTKNITAKAAFKGESPERYFAPPKGLDLHGSSLSAALDFSYSGDLATARLEGKLTGVRSSYVKESRPLDLSLTAGARYTVSSGTLELGQGRLDVPGVAGLGFSGEVNKVPDDPELDLTVSPSPVELARLMPYLPAGTRAEGVIRFVEVRVKGKLRGGLPQTAGGLSVSGAGLYYKGMSLKDINGSARFNVSPGGRVDTAVSLASPAVSLTGTAAYGSGSGTFRLRCKALDLAQLGLGDLGPEGKADAEVSGDFGRPAGRAHAVFKVSGSGVALKKAGISASGVVLSGDAVMAGPRLSVSGVLSAEKAGVKGRIIDSVSTGFSWAPGALSLNGISLKAADFQAAAGPVSVSYTLPEGTGPLRMAGSFDALSAEAHGASLSGFSGSWRYQDGTASVEVSGQALGNPVTLSGGGSFSGGKGLINPYLSGKLDVVQASSLNPVVKKSNPALSIAKGGLSAAFSLRGPDLDRLAGSGFVRADGLGFDMGGKPLLRDLSFELKPVYENNTFSLPESAVSFGGSFGAAVSGGLTRDAKGWSGRFTAMLPDTTLASLQEGVLDALPPKLKWADVSGAAKAEAGVQVSIPAAGEAVVRLTGSLTLKGATLSIPDQKVTVGPADGTVPLAFSLGGKGAKATQNPFGQESFEREEFGSLVKKYSSVPASVGLKVGKASFGLFEVDDIRLSLTPGDGWYKVDWLGMKGFGGAAYGNAFADFTGAKGPKYAFSLLVSGLSMAEVCKRVPGIEGYLSGKVNGMVRVLVSGQGYADVAGAASFWSYDAPDEKRKISKEFLKRLMGKSMQTYMLMGDRSFDTGELDAIFSDGYIVFDRLIISHTNFIGRQDLKVSVAPVSNKVALEHLLEVMQDVSERAGAIK